jgi:hypothetical protein
MGTRVLRSLLTACCLVLMLPPGWCGLVPTPAAGAKAEAAKKAPGACCEPCPCKRQRKPPPGSSRPAPPPCRCYCYDLDWLKPPAPEKAEADLSPAAFVAPADCLPTYDVLRHDRDLSLPVPSPPPHVLKCVWLC